MSHTHEVTPLVALLWVAAGTQVAIAAANLLLPRTLDTQEGLRRLPPILRQIFIVHWAYIVGVLLLFATLTFGFVEELASGRGLGRFMAGAISLFWMCRLPLQLLYYDHAVRRQNRAADIAFVAAIAFLALTYTAAVLVPTAITLASIAP